MFTSHSLTKKHMQEITFHLSTLCLPNPHIIPIDSTWYMLHTTPYSIFQRCDCIQYQSFNTPNWFKCGHDNLLHSKRIFSTRLSSLHWLRKLGCSPWLLGTWLVAQINMQAGYLMMQFEHRGIEDKMASIELFFDHLTQGVHYETLHDLSTLWHIQESTDIRTLHYILVIEHPLCWQKESTIECLYLTGIVKFKHHRSLQKLLVTTIWSTYS